MKDIKMINSNDINAFSYEEISDKLISIEKILKETIEKNNEFISKLAHDLKNPFQGFLGLTELLMTQIDEFSREDIIDAASEINKSAHGLYWLINNLYNLSKVRTGTFNLYPSEIYIKDTTDSVILSFQRTIIKKNLNVINNIPIGSKISTDYNLLNIVLSNILSNAIKFTEPNGEIVFDFGIINDYNLIEVSDNGIGIKSDNIPRLFDSSFTRHGSVFEQGSGIGLQLCSEILALAKGKISVKSEYGSWSKFSIYLPK